jgi:hypothetical protein
LAYVFAKIKTRRKADEKNPDKVIISFGGTELSFSKTYYSKPQVMANWTRSVREMKQIMTTGKTLEEAPIPESRQKELTDYSKRISEFEILVSKNTPEPEKASEVDVSADALLEYSLWLTTNSTTINLESWQKSRLWCLRFHLSNISKLSCLRNIPLVQI